jgi:hypothetical protein
MSLPCCPNCHHEQRLAGENEHHWAFRCPYCRTVRIISKPTLRGASRLEVEMGRHKARMAQERQLESLPRYSFPGGK